MTPIMYPMRVTRQLLAEHRVAMLRQASRLFRAHGIDRVGVADITRAAGLTHGAFYGHFPSKAALASEACDASLARAADRWRALAAEAAGNGEDGLGAVIDRYVSPSHRDDPGGGCALVALGAEAARDPALVPGMTSGTEALLAALDDILATARPGVPAAERPGIALAVLAAMNGGVLLARALADRPDRSDAALTAARRAARRAAEFS